ncbi:MAG: hypothetical protein AAF718_00865 [Pseudomonadota bacterium]
MKSFLLIASLALLSTGAQAQSTSERITTFADGSTFRTTTQSVRSDNTRAVTTTGVGSDGRGYTRTAVWQWDPTTNSWKKTVVGQTANGKTWTNNGNGSCAEGACSSTSTFTGANGETATRRSTSVRENGVTNRRTERTTRRGTTVREWKRVR